VTSPYRSHVDFLEPRRLLGRSQSRQDDPHDKSQTPDNGGYSGSQGSAHGPQPHQGATGNSVIRAGRRQRRLKAVPFLGTPFPNHETSHIIPPPRARCSCPARRIYDPGREHNGCPGASLPLAKGQAEEREGKSRESSRPAGWMVGPSPRDSDEFLTEKIS
jgi:hypothetical protein